MELLKYLLVVVLFQFWIQVDFIQAASSSHEEDVYIKPEEVLPLKKLKEAVIQNLTEYYMKNDVYLARWLRASEGNVAKAEENVFKMLEWRKEIGIDEIMKEDFSDLEREFPFDTNAVDYQGRPVGTADIAEWDARKIVLSGNIDKAIRYVYKVVETGAKKGMETYLSGRNVSQWVIIANLKGFNNQQHGCSNCLALFRNLISSVQFYYTRSVYRFICVNTPVSFANILTPFMKLVHPSRWKIIKLHGSDKRQWQKVVLNLVNPNQIGPQFGGNKIPIDLEFQ